MATEITQKVIDVFLASPGDLNEERKIIKKAIDLANEIVRDQGWRIELYGWEDTLPGCCRPQALINVDVDRCSLFIGMLSNRWGQSTGLFTSGFEEEFDRARKRNSETGLPEIWIFFKKIDPALLTDPGEQLKRVISFRGDLEQRKEIFFREFEKTVDLNDSVLKFLLRYILKSPQKAPAINESQQAPEKSDMKQLVNLDKATVPKQLTELMEIATDAICSGKFSFSQFADLHDEQFNIIRLYLIASALVFQRYTNDLLGTHEINLLYLHREKLEMLSWEGTLILRTIIGNSSDVTPGWYWFKGSQINIILRLLYYFVIIDNSDANVRMNALALMRDARIRPNRGWLTSDLDPIELLLDINDKNLKPLIYSYLAEVGTCDDLPLLDRASKIEDKSIYQHVLFAKVSIMSRKDPNNALSQILSFSTDLISKSMLSIIEKDAGKMQSTLLLDAMYHYNFSVRLLAISELEKRGELTQEHALSLLDSSNGEMKEKLYKFLIKKGWKEDISLIKEGLSIDAREEILFSLYNECNEDELQKKLDWYRLDGPIIYKALGLRNYESMKTKIIANLDDDFRDFQDVYVDKFKQTYGDNSVKYLKDYEGKLNDFIRNNFVTSALSIISEHNNPENVRIARKYIDSDYESIKKLAIQIIAENGDSSDVPKLITICTNSYGEISELAANSALQLDPGISGAVSSFLLANDIRLIKFALKYLRTEPIEITKSIAETLLLNNNDSIRRQAVFFLINKLPKEELEELLRSYPKTHYYYNVICWLDRFLYAPSPFKEVFIKKMENELDP